VTPDLAPGAAPAAAPTTTLHYLPVALFGGVMGLTGLASAWRQASILFGAPAWPGQALSVLALLAFSLLTGAYAVKSVASLAAVRAEFDSPVAGPLFGTPIISLLLLPLVMAEYSLPLARALWCIGAFGMTLLAWLIVNRWIGERQQNSHAVPAWIVPVVGLIDVPLAIPALHWTQYHGLMMFALAVGLFFAVPLFTIILSRLMFDTPIAPAMQPTLLILVAPFSVGFSAYVSTTGTVDAFAQALYMLMLFLLAVVVHRVRHLRQCCPFRFAWWSASFPLAASAGAALRYAAHARDAWTDAIAIALLVIATTVVLALLAWTVSGIWRGDLQKLSGP
jgi:tellurite resistance protein